MQQRAQRAQGGVRHATAGTASTGGSAACNSGHSEHRGEGIRSYLALAAAAFAALPWSRRPCVPLSRQVTCVAVGRWFPSSHMIERFGKDQTEFFGGQQVHGLQLQSLWRIRAAAVGRTICVWASLRRPAWSSPRGV